MVPGALIWENVFSSLLQRETGYKRDRTAQRGRSQSVPDHMRIGEAPLSGRILESGAGHCLLVCGGPSHP